MLVSDRQILPGPGSEAVVDGFILTVGSSGNTDNG